MTQAELRNLIWMQMRRHGEPAVYRAIAEAIDETHYVLHPDQKLTEAARLLREAAEELAQRRRTGPAS